MQHPDPALPDGPTLARLFDALADTVFFVKDAEGRYRVVNQTLATRLGRRSADELVGRRVDEVFPAELGASFRAQDEGVMRTGAPIRERLELHLYPDRQAGWCRTTKLPLRDGVEITGLVGISRDLRVSGAGTEGALLSTLESAARDPAGLDVAGLARRCGLSRRTLERRVRDHLGLSAGEWIIKARLDLARELLSDPDLSIAEIAHRIGYADHSAFTRQFRARLGVTPRRFRRLG